MKGNMKAERARAGMTAKDVASKLGVHENSVLNWESGDKEPMGRNLVMLAELYGCTPEYLLGLTDDRHGTKCATNADMSN